MMCVVEQELTGRNGLERKVSNNQLFCPLFYSLLQGCVILDLLAKLTGLKTRTLQFAEPTSGCRQK
jgi:hypothetical protein